MIIYLLKFNFLTVNPGGPSALIWEGDDQHFIFVQGDIPCDGIFFCLYIFQHIFLQCAYPVSIGVHALGVDGDIFEFQHSVGEEFESAGIYAVFMISQVKQEFFLTGGVGIDAEFIQITHVIGFYPGFQEMFCRILRCFNITLQREIGFRVWFTFESEGDRRSGTVYGEGVLIHGHTF